MKLIINKDKNREDDLRIVSATKALIAQRMDLDFSLIEIAKEAGLPVAVVDRQVCDVDSVFVSIFSTYLDNFKDLLAIYLDGCRSVADIENGIKEFVCYFCDVISDEKILNVLWRSVKTGKRPALAERLEQAMIAQSEMLGSALCRLSDDLTPETAYREALLVFNSIGHTATVTQNLEKQKRKQFAEEAGTLLLLGLRRVI